MTFDKRVTLAIPWQRVCCLVYDFEEFLDKVFVSPGHRPIDFAELQGKSAAEVVNFVGRLGCLIDFTIDFIIDFIIDF